MEGTESFFRVTSALSLLYNRRTRREIYIAKEDRIDGGSLVVAYVTGNTWCVVIWCTIGFHRLDTVRSVSDQFCATWRSSVSWWSQTKKFTRGCEYLLLNGYLKGSREGDSARDLSRDLLLVYFIYTVWLWCACFEGYCTPMRCGVYPRRNDSKRSITGKQLIKCIIMWICQWPPVGFSSERPSLLLSIQRSWRWFKTIDCSNTFDRLEEENQTC